MLFWCCVFVVLDVRFSFWASNFPFNSFAVPLVRVHCHANSIIPYNLFSHTHKRERSQETTHQANAVPIQFNELIWIHCVQTGCRMQIRHFNWDFSNCAWPPCLHIHTSTHSHILTFINIPIHTHTHTLTSNSRIHLLHIDGAYSNSIIIDIQVYLLCFGYAYAMRRFFRFNAIINNVRQTMRENRKCLTFTCKWYINKFVLVLLFFARTAHTDNLNLVCFFSTLIEFVLIILFVFFLNTIFSFALSANRTNNDWLWSNSWFRDIFFRCDSLIFFSSIYFD